MPTRGYGLGIRWGGQRQCCSDEKILVTGPAGQIAFPLCAVPGGRQRGLGHRPLQPTGEPGAGGEAGRDHPGRRPGRPGLERVPDDFTYVLHLAASRRRDSTTTTPCGSTPKGSGACSTTAAGPRRRWSCRPARSTCPTTTRGTPTSRPIRSAGPNCPVGADLLGVQAGRGGGRSLQRPGARPARGDRPHELGVRQTTVACPSSPSTRSWPVEPVTARFDPSPLQRHPSRRHQRTDRGHPEPRRRCRPPSSTGAATRRSASSSGRPTSAS